MDKDIFLELVNNLENVSRWKLKDSPLARALAEFAYQRQIQDLPFLNELVERLVPVLQTESVVSSWSELNSEVLVTSDFLAERILPWVELVRTELFGSRNAPFRSTKEAEDWIQEQAKDQRLFPIGGNLEERLGHLISSGRVQVAAPPERSFEYLGEDGKVHQITIMDIQRGEWKTPESRPRYTERGIPALRWLDNETRIMANATGFEQPSLVQFVLVGVSPVLPRYLVRVEADHQATPAGDILQPYKLKIEILARDLGFEELRRIYQTYRRELKSRKAKALSDEHWAIYRLVKEKGGPVSGKGSVQFWKSVMEQWNILLPERKYSHWKGVKIAYERIIRRLETKLRPGAER